jgi:hypothetical protein
MFLNKRLINTATSLPPPEIGQLREGGIVFYINEASSYGFVVSLDTWQVRYGTTTYVYSPVELRSYAAKQIGSGANNTALMLSTFGASNTTHIAYYTQAYNAGGNTDWYIPSNLELRQYANIRGTIDAAIIDNGGTTRNTGGFLASNLKNTQLVDSISFVSGADYTVGITQNLFNTKFIRTFTF